MLLRFSCCSLALFLLIGPPATSQNKPPSELTIESIMRDPKWIGTSPYDVRWSDDGRQVYFMWNPENAEKDALYSVLRDGGLPRRVTDEELPAIPSEDGNSDHERAHRVFDRNGDIFLFDVRSGQVQQLTRTTAQESEPAFTADGHKITFVCDRNLYLMDLSAGGVTQLTDFQTRSLDSGQRQAQSEQQQWLSSQEKRLFETLREKKTRPGRRHGPQASDGSANPPRIAVDSGQVSGLTLSPDQRYITFMLEFDPDSVKAAIIPNYVTESGFTTTRETRAKVGGPRSTYRLGIYDDQRDTAYYVFTSELPDICRKPEYLNDYPGAIDSMGAKSNYPCPRQTFINGPYWSDDGSRAVVDIRALDHKDRWIATLNLETGGLTTLDHQHDEAWISGPGVWGYYGPGSLGWLPDNRRLWFQSEATGYSHLYVVDVVTGKKTQLTNGTFEVSDAVLSHDGRYFYFVSNEVNPGERHFYRLSSRGGRPEQVTRIPGSVEVFISPDETKLALLHSTNNQPWELFFQDNRPDAGPEQITHSVSDEFKAYPWREPEVVTFGARDSAVVYARIYQPKEPQPGGPAVMFVHGAGYMQNVCNRWTWYFREQMFHNFLADRGYLVMDVDYRGSAGYGRDWRTGIYRHMGGKDLSDYVDGVRFLVDKYGIDPKRVGIYGGSYGGFLALMAVFTEPDVFAAGAALRPVADWAHYEHEYTSEILNLPYTDSLAYIRSSPIYFAEGFRGALLMCHGMLDDNVHFQDVVRLSQRLIELGKDNWELAPYPAEGHTFRNASSWIDEYKRIYKLFEENLK